MNVAVREANLPEERSALVEVLQESLAGWADDTRFDWLYFDNPFGNARCWVLDDSEGIAGENGRWRREKAGGRGKGAAVGEEGGEGCGRREGRSRRA